MTTKDTRDALAEHPVQPIVMVDGVKRFKENKIVSYLSNGRLNDLRAMDFSDADWQQMAQLIGYSVSGWGTLSYVTDEAYERVQAALATPDAASGQGLADIDAIARKHFWSLTRMEAPQWRGFARELLASQPAERERLRAAQTNAVMPLIGPLLDAWESCAQAVRSEQPELAEQLRLINRAMEDAEPAQQPEAPASTHQDHTRACDLSQAENGDDQCVCPPHPQQQAGAVSENAAFNAAYDEIASRREVTIRRIARYCWDATLTHAQTEQPTFHLRSYGDVTAAQLEEYTRPTAQQEGQSAADYLLRLAKSVEADCSGPVGIIGSVAATLRSVAAQHYTPTAPNDLSTLAGGEIAEGAGLSACVTCGQPAPQGQAGGAK